MLVQPEPVLADASAREVLPSSRLLGAHGKESVTDILVLSDEEIVSVGWWADARV